MLGLGLPVTGWQDFEGHELMDIMSAGQPPPESFGVVGWRRRVTRVKQPLKLSIISWMCEF